MTRSYHWTSLSRSKGVKKKLSRAVQQFTPYKWDKVEWHCMSSVRSLLLTSVMVVLFLTCEANAFFLKFVLWIPPNNNLNLVRLAFWLPFGAHAGHAVPLHFVPFVRRELLHSAG